jgi:hypothetical protein
MNNYLPPNIVNLITDFNQCACGWSIESNLSHAEFSDKDCENINYHHERCFDCKDDLVKETSYINVKIRCQKCHINTICDSVINYDTESVRIYQMVGFQYKVYFDSNDDQIKTTKISNGWSGQEEDTNELLFELKTNIDMMLLESEIPKGLEHLFRLSTV